MPSKAILLDIDGSVRITKSGKPCPSDPEDIEILPNTKEILEFYKNQGYLLLGVSNQGGISQGYVSKEQVEACFQRTQELLGLEIEIKYCPHPVYPISCFCRKPGTEFGMYFVSKYKLNPKDCVVVGDMESDKAFAANCGFQFAWADDFFKRK